MSENLNRSQREPIRVLAVDDDPIQRSLIQARLYRLNAHTTEAADGIEAWSLLRSQNFDLAIVDLSMPNLDGIGLIQCMRGHPRTRHMPIIVITSRSDTAAIEASLQAGASSFLVKPVAWSMFEHHVGFLMQLVRSAKEARSVSRRAMAASLAKDTIIGSLFGDTASNAQSILQNVRSMRQTVATHGGSSLDVQRIESIEAECHGVLASARRALKALHLLTEQVVVGDRETRLSEIVERVVQAARPEALDTGIELSVTLPADDALISCEADAIELALISLLENAIKHAPPESTVTIAGTVHPDGMLGLAVADQGQGMSQDILLRCLSPLRTDLEDLSGHTPIGTGLLLARAIVEAHEGKLEIRSMQGDGTTASLFLPPERVRVSAKAA